MRTSRRFTTSWPSRPTAACEHVLTGGTSGSGSLTALRCLFQVLAKGVLFGFGGEQPKLGTTPQDIFKAGSPLMLAQVIHLAGKQPCTDGLTQVLRAFNACQKRPDAAAIGACQRWAMAGASQVCRASKASSSACGVVMSSPPGRVDSAVQLPPIWLKNGLSSAMADSASLR